MAKQENKDYKAANKNFLKKLSNDPEVELLGSGVMRRIIHQGEADAPSPILSSVVSVHYRGTLINGKEFDSSYENAYPETFRLREVIEGWQIALPRMRVGDKWQIYVPSDLGYGRKANGNIPGWSTLIFEIELLAVD